MLPDVAAPGFDVHLVYADALRQSKRVAAFRDFAVKSSRDWSTLTAAAFLCRVRPAENRGHSWRLARPETRLKFVVSLLWAGHAQAQAPYPVVHGKY